MAANSLNVNLDEMPVILGEMGRNVEEFENINSLMSAHIRSLCEIWRSRAADTYQDNFDHLADQLTQATNDVGELIRSAQSYVNAVNAVEDAYSS